MIVDMDINLEDLNAYRSMMINIFVIIIKLHFLEWLFHMKAPTFGKLAIFGKRLNCMN